MTDIDSLASALFGSKRAETQEVLTDATTRTYVGTALTDSVDGTVFVDLGGDVTLPDDVEGIHEHSAEGIEVSTGPGVRAGDEVIVTLVGGTPLKTPMVTGVAGEGDDQDARIATASAAAEEAWQWADEAHDAATEAQESADAAQESASSAASAASSAVSSAARAEQSAQQAIGDAARAESAAQQAVEDAADAAQAAGEAKTSAQQAVEEANEAHDAATAAQAEASRASQSATEAKGAATRANTAANDALAQVATVEDVIGVVDWVTEHGTYSLTTDTAIDPDKVYYTRSGSGTQADPYLYTAVPEPVAEDLGTYYELSVQEALSQYVASHLALTDAGLYVLKDGSGYRLLLTNDGMQVIDPAGHTVATYGESITFDSERPQRIGGTNSYIEWRDTNGDGAPDSLVIVADSIELGSGQSVSTGSGNVWANHTSATSASGISSWSDSFVAPTTAKPYVWMKSYSIIDGQRVYGNPACITGAKGADGTSVTVSSTATSYTSSTSGTTIPTSGWQSTVPSVAQGSYLWTRVVTTFSDSKTATSYTASRQGANGTNGTNGTSVTVSSTAYAYQLSTSGTTVPTGTWQTTPQAPTTTQYAWTRTTTTYSDGSTSVTYTVGGKAGTGVTVSKVEYGTSTSASTQPSSWSTTVPTSITKGRWLWVKTSYSDGTSAFTKSYAGTDGEDGTSVFVQSATKTGDTTTVVIADSEGHTSTLTIKDGEDGQNGTNGTDGLTGYVHTAWANSANGATDFSTTVSANKKYLGVYTDNTAADSQRYQDYSWSLIKGADGTSVSVTSIEYATSTTESQPSSGWSTTAPSTVAEGSWLWTRVNYSDGSAAVSRAKQGKSGTSGSSSYTHIRYSAQADGTGFVSTPTASTVYVGIAVTSSSSAPTAKGSYTWSRYVGQQGPQGPQGKTGETGVGIESYAQMWAKSTSKTTAPTSGWSESRPTSIGTNEYLWVRIDTTWTDGSTTQGTPVVDLNVTDLWHTSAALRVDVDSIDSDVEGLKTTVSGHTTTIQQHTTSIGQNTDAIALRATKTEVQQVRPAYASSSTAAGTATKAATIDPAVTGYALYKGASVAVTFSTANTAATPTLNLNSTGAKQIRSYTGAALSEAEYKWAAGATIDLVYDGTYWRMQDGGSVKRVTSAEASIKVNADNIESKVSKDGVISSINQSAETVKIKAEKVEIDGAAVFTAISSDVDDAITDKGYQTSSQVESAITSKGYQTSSQVESAITSKGYQTASQVSTAVTNGTANLAPKANAVKRTQRIWYRTNGSSAPSTPGAASSNWVTKADDGNDAWTKMHIAINSTHKYIYTCEQYEMANGTVGYTSVLLDNTITVIDGGNIITGSVTANKLDAANINASKTLTVGAMTDAAASSILNSNVQVGGRNLLLGAATQDTSVGNSRESVNETNDTWLGCKVFRSSAAWADIGFRFDIQVVNRGLVKAGDVLTYSIWAKTDDTTSRDIYGVWMGAKSGSAHMNGAKIATLTSEWTRYEKQIIVTQAMLNTATVGMATRFECNTNCTSGKYIYWAAPKLEKGNKATDWTQAPEDQTAYVDKSINDIDIGGRNLLRRSYYQLTTTMNGVTFTNNGDGSVTVNGTTTATPTAYLFNDSSASSRGHVTLEAGTYTLSGCPDGGGDETWRLDMYDIPTSSGTTVAVDYGDGATFTTTGGTPTLIRMRFPSGITLNNFTVWPKLERGNKATDWTPAPEDMATAESLAGTNESLEGAIADIGELSDQLVGTTTEQNKTITTIQTYLNSLRKDLDAEIRSRQQWLNFNAAEGLVIGAAGSSFKTVTTNTSQQFRSGGTVLAETSGAEFVAPVMRSDQLLIGNWMWTRRDNGNLSLKWIG